MQGKAPTKFETMPIIRWTNFVTQADMSQAATHLRGAGRPGSSIVETYKSSPKNNSHHIQAFRSHTAWISLRFPDFHRHRATR